MIVTARDRKISLLYEKISALKLNPTSVCERISAAAFYVGQKQAFEIIRKIPK